MRTHTGTRSPLLRLVALLAALGLIAAACEDADFADEPDDDPIEDDIEEDPDPDPDEEPDEDEEEEDEVAEVRLEDAPISDPPDIECGVTPEDVEEQTINFGIGLAGTSPQGLSVEFFGDYLEECTDGALTVELFPDSQIGDDLEMMDGLQTGTLEMTFPSTSPAVEIVPELGVFDLPFLMPDNETADEVLDSEIGDQLLDEFEGTGIKALEWAENGFRQVTNSVGPIEEPADLEGLNLRVMENPIHVDTWETLGADPTSMAFGEVFSALEQGVIDGQENPWSTNVTSNFWEVNAYGSETRHVYTPFIMMMAEDFYEGFPEDVQELIDEAAEETKFYQRTISREMDEWSREQFDDLGPDVNVLDEDQLDEFAEAAQPVYDEWRDEIGEDLVDDVLEMTQS